MPRDQRLFMTFPIDMHRHPKLSRLPAEVRWTFIEMNGEARIAENDGRFAAEEAEFMWPQDHLQALADSHPTRPLIIREGAFYVIRDYAEHQFTKADRDELRRKRSDAGKLGGQAKALASAKQVPSKTKQALAESESESEIDRPTYVNESSHLGNRARETDDIIPRTTIQGLGIDPTRLIKHISARVARDVNATVALRVALDILDRGRNVQKPQAYVLGSITKSPFEVQQFIDGST